MNTPFLSHAATLYTHKVDKGFIIGVTKLKSDPVGMGFTFQLRYFRKERNLMRV
jgi:hypothetical protein